MEEHFSASPLPLSASNHLFSSSCDRRSPVMAVCGLTVEDSDIHFTVHKGGSQSQVFQADEVRGQTSSCHPLELGFER